MRRPLPGLELTDEDFERFRLLRKHVARRHWLLDHPSVLLLELVHLREGVVDRPQLGSRAGVTLLGDAAYVTAPNGEGANLAMFDGAELGKALAARPDDVEAALFEYEQPCSRGAGKRPGRVRIFTALGSKHTKT